MTIRKIFFWLHLAAGCVGGIIILIMSLTGVFLAYERQILASVERAPFRVTPPAKDARPLAPEQLLATVMQQSGKLPGNATLTLRSDPREPAELGAGREGAPVYLNPYTGQVLGSPSTTWRGVFREVTAWHRWLGAKGEGRAVAKAVTGACNLAFLGLVLSGIYLWLPKQWTRRHLAAITWFRGEASGKAREYNWHNVFGIWTAVPLFFIVLSAVPMSYNWANNLIYRWTGSEPPAGRPGQEGPRRREQRPPDFSGLNDLYLRASAHVRGWQSIAVRVPEGRRPVSFQIDLGDGGQPQKRSTLTLDRTTGELVKWETFADQNTGRRIRMYSRFLHTGEVWGLVGQTIALVASGAGVMLVYTGIALALRRYFAWRGRRRRKGDADAGISPACAGSSSSSSH